MNAYIDYHFPDEDFWGRYRQLWENSRFRSAYQSPQFIRHLAEQQSRELAVYRFHQGSELAGAAFFRREGGSYSFLSDIKTDHNFFVIHRDCGKDEVKVFFHAFLKELEKEKWSLVLNNLPAWADYMEDLVEAGQASGLFWQNLPYTVCPMLEAESPQELFSRFGGSRNLRYKMNRLNKEQGADLEVYREDEDLDQWTEDFCRSHIVRWASTPTPSAYRDPANREALKGYLRAWIRDGILVRFSIRAGGERIALCIGLIQEQSLIHHSHTYNTAFDKYSPGKVLLYHIGQWMEAEQLNVLDFGVGEEGFKYEYANKVLGMNRIFVSGRANLPFVLKARLIRAIRERSDLYLFYRDKVKPLALKFLP